MNTSCGLLVTL